MSRQSFLGFFDLLFQFGNLFFSASKFIMVPLINTEQYKNFHHEITKVRKNEKDQNIVRA